MKILLIGYVKKKDEEMCKRFGVTKFPTLLVVQNIENDMVTEDSVTTVYEGSLKIDEIQTFLNKFALKIKRYITAQRSSQYGVDEKTRTKNYLLKQLNHTNIQEWFVNNLDEDVIIYFGTNTVKKNQTQAISFETKKILKSLHGKYKQGYINCHSPDNEKVCKNNFNLRSYPSLILYTAKQDQYIEDKVKNGINLPVLSHTVLFQTILEKFQGMVNHVDEASLGNFIRMSVKNRKALLIHLFNNTVRYYC